MTPGPSKPQIVDALDDARRRTLGLLDPIPPADQMRQVSELMSPLCWDLAHIGHYEELWLVRTLSGAAPTDPAFDDIYDAFKHPRRDRVSLPILDPAGARAFVADVRERTSPRARRIHARRRRSAARRRLRVRHGRAARASTRRDAARHAPAHGRLRPSRRRGPPGRRHHASRRRTRTCRSRTRRADPGRDVHDRDESTIPGRTTTNDPSTRSRSRRFASTPHRSPIGRTASSSPPVGTTTTRVWSDAGWAWRQEAALVAPQFWHHEGGGSWSRRRFGRTEDLPLDEPVQHVCWYEADAFARWSGARLPSETEWEIASAGASLDHANLWHAGPHRFGPSDTARAHPDTVSKWGVHQMFGDVWEWTASDFRCVPGLRVVPLPRVLRGLLRTRLQGPARRVRGQRTRPPCARRSATGTTRSVGRSSPASAARATLDDSCAVTSRISVPRSRSTSCCSARSAFALRPGAHAAAPDVG